MIGAVRDRLDKVTSQVYKPGTASFPDPGGVPTGNPTSDPGIESVTYSLITGSSKAVDVLTVPNNYRSVAVFNASEKQIFLSSDGSVIDVSKSPQYILPPYAYAVFPMHGTQISYALANTSATPLVGEIVNIEASPEARAPGFWKLPDGMGLTKTGLTDAQGNPISVLPVSGTVTTNPSGTQQVAGTVNNVPPAGGTAVINPAGGALIQSPASGAQFPVAFGSLCEYTVTCNAALTNPVNGNYNTLNVNTPTGPNGAQGIGAGTNTGGTGPYWIGAMSHLAMVRIGINLVSVNNVASAMASGISVWVGFSIGTTLLGPYLYLFSEGFSLAYNANGQANYQEDVPIFSTYPLDVIGQAGSGAHLYPVVFVLGLPGGGVTNVLTIFMNLWYS